MKNISTGRFGYKNGKFLPEEQLTVHIYEEEFMFGSAVFEMFRTFKHKFFLFEEHIKRLFTSMKIYQIEIDKTANEIYEICHHLTELNADHFRNDEYRFMINVSRGPLSIYKDVFALEENEEWGKPTWIINAWPLSKTAKTMAHYYDTGANAVIVPQRQIPAQFLDPKVKSRSRAHLMLANLQASKFGKDALALLLDDDGFITEGTGSNFILIKDKSIVIPERRNVLRGCSMEFLLDLMHDFRLDLNSNVINIIEKNIEPYDVLTADEAMFTGTFTNLIPCNRFNGSLIYGAENRKNVGDLDPMGPITHKICDRWSEHVKVDFIKQVKGWNK